MFIYKSWFLNIDVEISQSQNMICLAEKTDAYGEAGLDIHFSITNSTLQKLALAREKIKSFLIENNIRFEEINADATTVKIEDVYHPYALFRYEPGDTIFTVYHPLENLFMFNTGILKRAGAINPTASLFCLIEQHVEEMK